MDEVKIGFLKKVIKKYKGGECDRLEIIDALLVIAGVDDDKTCRCIKSIFKDCSKIYRKVGQPRKVKAEEILIRKIGGDTFQKISDDLRISVSTVYRTIRDNKELEQKMRAEIFGLGNKK